MQKKSETKQMGLPIIFIVLSSHSRSQSYRQVGSSYWEIMIGYSLSSSFSWSWSWILLTGVNHLGLCGLVLDLGINLVQTPSILRLIQSFAFLNSTGLYSLPMCSTIPLTIVYGHARTRIR